jgi:hypothetical protein
VREMLNIKRSDLVFGRGYVVVCLGETKRGREQKVCISQSQVVLWLRAYMLGLDLGPHDRVFPRSYTTVLKWLRAAAQAVGAGQLDLTTHSLRRSGASELMRLGCQWEDIREYGRWNSDRAARTYARQGEVAIYRARNELHHGLLERAQRWNNMSHLIWHTTMLVQTFALRTRRRAQLTKEHVSALDAILTLVAKQALTTK